MRADECGPQWGHEDEPAGRSLTHMRNSGKTDSLVMGLLLKAMVATGAKATNKRILLATSGRLEKAMNAGSTHTHTHTHSHDDPATTAKMAVKGQIQSQSQF